jgi:glycosyltransferase involved in cell wall biosynthesis
MAERRSGPGDRTSEGGLSLLHVSDHRYYLDDGGEWLTEVPLPLPELASAFPAPVTHWTFFGRLLRVPPQAEHLSPVRPGRGMIVGFRGVHDPIAGATGFARRLGAYHAALRTSLDEADVVWAKLSHVASVLAFVRRPQRPFMIAHLTGDPGDALDFRRGPFWRGVGLLSRRLNRRALAKADLCLFVSEFLRKRFGPPGRPAFVVHEAGVRGDDFVAEPRKLAPDPPTLLYVGRLAPEKGVDVLLHAMVAVTESSDAKLRIVGAGRERQRLVSLARRLALAERVEFVGPLAWGKHLFAEMRRATCLVAPSRSEGYGLAILEAQAQGTPVVASAVGGVPEAVDGGRAGVLVPPGDPVRLAAAIGTVLSDAELQKRLSEQGLRFARLNTLDAQVNRLKGALAAAGLHESAPWRRTGRNGDS